MFLTKVALSIVLIISSKFLIRNLVKLLVLVWQICVASINLLKHIAFKLKSLILKKKLKSVDSNGALPDGYQENSRVKYDEISNTLELTITKCKALEKQLRDVTKMYEEEKDKVAQLTTTPLPESTMDVVTKNYKFSNYNVTRTTMRPIPLTLPRMEAVETCREIPAEVMAAAMVAVATVAEVKAEMAETDKIAEEADTTAAAVVGPAVAEATAAAEAEAEATVAEATAAEVTAAVVTDPTVAEVTAAAVTEATVAEAIAIEGPTVAEANSAVETESATVLEAAAEMELAANTINNQNPLERNTENHGRINNYFRYATERIVSFWNEVVKLLSNGYNKYISTRGHSDSPQIIESTNTAVTPPEDDHNYLYIMYGAAIATTAIICIVPILKRY